MTVAAIVELAGQPNGVPIRYTVAGGVGIEEGTLMAFSGASIKSVKANASTGEKFAGIASVEKVASDTSTTLGLWTKGIFDLICSGDVVLGEPVQMSGANIVAKCEDKPTSGARQVVGTALETGTDGNPLQVAIGIY